MRRRRPPFGRTFLHVLAPLLLALASAGCASSRRTTERKGLAFSRAFIVRDARLLVDETCVDEAGTRRVNQEIFDEIFRAIDEADRFVLLDLFLVNDFLYEPGPGLRPLSRELTDVLLAKRRKRPDVPIVFVTDPVNELYGSLRLPQFDALERAGVRVVRTNLDALRDSNPLYSKPWRLLVRPWGVGPGNFIDNPLGDGGISLRSLLKLLNFKANHRKLVATDKTLLVTSANPHDASSAHWNVGLELRGAPAAVAAACEAESALLRLSGTPAFRPALPKESLAAPPAAARGGELLTESKIKQRAIEWLDAARPGDRIDLVMFYFADRDLVRAFRRAQRRGCRIRVLLDPNKDAFGRTKNGIPNRQTARRLVAAGIPVRWADTHGEQCHAKMLYVERADGTAALLLGSANYTRRNLDDFNAELDLAYYAAAFDPVMARARETFDRWWNNLGGRRTVPYETYADDALLRRCLAPIMEATGLSTF